MAAATITVAYDHDGLVVSYATDVSLDDALALITRLLADDPNAAPVEVAPVGPTPADEPDPGPPGDATICCGDCGRRFTTTQGLTLHRTCTHGKKKAPAKPAAAEKVAAAPPVRKQRPTWAGVTKAGVTPPAPLPKPTPVACTLCGDRFDTNADLSRHRLRMHANRDGEQRDELAEVLEEFEKVLG